MQKAVVRRALALTCLLVPALLSAGCGGKAVLWGNTASSKDDGFSTDKVQWAYDGETVTFDFWTKSSSDYVVFECTGDAVAVPMDDKGTFQWSRSFKAGTEPKNYTVWATGYLRRGRVDWVYDKTAKEWYILQGYRDKADKITGEKRMTIRCYRIELRIEIAAPEGRPKSVSLALIKEDGTRVKVAQRTSLLGDKRGFLLIGPEDGNYHVLYAPTYKEVSRTGYTIAEVIVEHAGGRIARIEQRWQTP